MKVLPLVLVLLVVISLSVQQDLATYKIEKMGRIDHLGWLLTNRESGWGDKIGEKPDPSPKDPSGPQQEAKQSPSPKTQKIFRELNIYTLIDPDQFGKDPERDNFSLRIIERLFEAHFKESPLYKELKEEDSALIAHFFEALREKGKEIKLNIGNAYWADLAQIPLEDSRYQVLLYQILKGERLNPRKTEKAWVDEDQIPLMNSLKIQKKEGQIRLFTATPPLIQALSDKTLDLESLISKRAEIRRALRRKEDKEQLTQQWKQYLKEIGLDLPEKFVSYELSTT